LNKKLALIFSLALAATVAVCLGFPFGPDYRGLVRKGTIQANEIVIVSKIGGRVAKVLVHEGEEVKPGQVLAEFDVPELEAKRDRCLAEIAESEAQFAALKSGARPYEIEKAKTQADQAFENWKLLKDGYRREDIEKAKAQRVEAQSNFELLAKGNRGEDIKQAQAMKEEARAQFEFADQDYRRFTDLFDKGAISKREVEDAKTRLKVAEQNLQAMSQLHQKMLNGPRLEEIQAARERVEYARNQERLVVSGPRPEEINMAHQQYLNALANVKLLSEGARREDIATQQARLAQAQARLKELEAQLKERKIEAFSDAEVSEMDLHVGQVVEANQAVAKLTSNEDVWAKVFLPEAELMRAPMGQAVGVVVEALPQGKFTGQVVQISGVSGAQADSLPQGPQLFEVKVKIDNALNVLRPGMKAKFVLPAKKGLWGRP
jgi:multidrug resistance efflux pump